jgi:hypothetical protein
MRWLGNRADATVAGMHNYIIALSQSLAAHPREQVATMWHGTADFRFKLAGRESCLRCAVPLTRSFGGRPFTVKAHLEWWLQPVAVVTLRQACRIRAHDARFTMYDVSCRAHGCKVLNWTSPIRLRLQLSAPQTKCLHAASCLDSYPLFSWLARD